MYVHVNVCVCVRVHACVYECVWEHVCTTQGMRARGNETQSLSHIYTHSTEGQGWVRGQRRDKAGYEANGGTRLGTRPTEGWYTHLTMILSLLISLRSAELSFIWKTRQTAAELELLLHRQAIALC